MQHDLQYIKEDLNSVERHRIDLYRARDRYSMKLRMLADDPIGKKPWSSSTDRNFGGLFSTSQNAPGGLPTGNLTFKKVDSKAQISSPGPQRKDTSISELNSQHMSQSGLAVVRKKRVNAQVCGCDIMLLYKFRNYSLCFISLDPYTKNIFFVLLVPCNKSREICYFLSILPFPLVGSHRVCCNITPIIK